MTKPIQSGTELIVALDFPDKASAESMMTELKGLPLLYKVGLELFTAVGPEWVKAKVEAGYRIFLDLKFHDIPNTVAKATLSASKLGVEMLTVHSVGGPRMFAAIKKESESYESSHAGKAKFPRILSVTVLTSFSEEDWGAVVSSVAGQTLPIGDAVTGLALSSSMWGAGGIVCSPHELSVLKKMKPDLYCVVPGIRPAPEPGQSAAKDDQARVMTPGEAARAGASAIVVGRPITQAKNPRQAAESVLQELGK